MFCLFPQAEEPKAVIYMFKMTVKLFEKEKKA